MKLSELSRRSISFPENWTVTKIENVGTLKSGSTPDRNNVDAYFRSGTIPWVKTLDLNNGLLKVTQEKITERALAETSCSIITKGSVLVAMYGGFNQIGRTGLLSIDAAINQALTAITITNGQLEPAYLLHWLNTFVEAWRRFAASSRKDPNITRQDVGSFPLAYPQIEEQRKICEIGNLWNSAIKQTENLINAKVKRKRGLIQQLLSGKRRFQEFAEQGWKETAFSDLLSESRLEGSHGAMARKMTVKLYGKGVTEKRDRLKGSQNTRYYTRKAGQFIYSKLDFLNGAFGIIPRNLDNYESTLDLPAFDIANGLNPQWLLYYVTQESFYTNYRNAAEGGRKARRVQPEELLKTKIKLPCIEEQNRIAEVLAACDKELDLLKQQLFALKRQKQGLMQKLLTGQHRVKIEDVEAATVEAR